MVREGGLDKKVDLNRFPVIQTLVRRGPKGGMWRCCDASREPRRRPKGKTTARLMGEKGKRGRRLTPFDAVEAGNPTRVEMGAMAKSVATLLETKDRVSQRGSGERVWRRSVVSSTRSAAIRATSRRTVRLAWTSLETKRWMDEKGSDRDSKRTAGGAVTQGSTANERRGRSSLGWVERRPSRGSIAGGAIRGVGAQG